MSFYKNAASALIESGAEPIFFDFEEVKLFSSDKTILRSTLSVSSLELGVLTMRQYRFVARRTAVGDQLVERHIHKLLYKLPELTEALPDVLFYTVPVYPRLLKNNTLCDILVREFSKNPKADLSRIAIEISADILYEQLDELTPELLKVKELGVKLIVSEVGDPFCPLLRLKKLPFDMAFLDTVALHLKDDDPTLPRSLVLMLSSLKLDAYACELQNEALVPLAESIGCKGYSVFATGDGAELADAPESFEVTE